jgi:hypothetical protein
MPSNFHLPAHLDRNPAYCSANIPDDVADFIFDFLFVICCLSFDA